MRGVDRRDEARRRFGKLLGESPEPDLTEASMLIAAEAYPDLEIDREISRVRIISAEAARRADGQDNPFARLTAVTSFLFDELGYRGNLKNFNDPRNCYLNEVLNRHLGIPITLSILLIEAARAAGFQARGVGLPGHFIVRVVFGDRTIYADAFNGGRVITEDDCRQLVVKTTGRSTLFSRDLLEGTDDRNIVARMLLNLKHVYVEGERYDQALAAVERLLLIRPGDPSEVRDRGFLKAYLGRTGPAIADLETYLVEAPKAPDVESVRGRVVLLRRQLSEMN